MNNLTLGLKLNDSGRGIGASSATIHPKWTDLTLTNWVDENATVWTID